MNERQQKIHALISNLAKTEDFEIVKRALYEAGYGIKGQIETTPLAAGNVEQGELRHAIVLDTETTGLDPATDKVIQLSMYKVSYNEAGIVDLIDFYDAYQDPGFPIPPEITEITGITDEMVAGKSIDHKEVRAFMDGADRVIAHNAEFDRKFCEAAFPRAGFDQIAWDCSIAQVDWKVRGEKSASLEVLALHMGMTYQAHNSASDIKALAYVLTHHKDKEGRTAFAEMLANSELKNIHIFAEGASYHKKDLLKNGGYRWAGDDEPVNGLSKVWHKTIRGTDEAIEEERDRLREVFGRDVSKAAFESDSMNRYSTRLRETKFHTKAPENAMDALKQTQMDLSHSAPTYGF